MIPADMEILSEGSIPIFLITTEDELECTFVHCPDSLWGITINTANKAKATLKILQGTDVLYDSAQDDNDLSMKIRGNTSALNDKKPFRLKFREKRSLIKGTEPDKEWLLLACGNNLQTEMGLLVNEMMGMPYTPQIQYINLIINGNYRGLYLCVESVKKGKSRVNISKKGFIMEYDGYWWNEPIYIPSPNTDRYSNYTFKYPKPKNVKEEEIASITLILERMEKSIVTGEYENFIDMESWVRYLIASDILGIEDKGGANIYLCKNDMTDETPIYIPTLWDFDSEMRSNNRWAAIHEAENHFFFSRLLENRNPSFKGKYKSIWMSERTRIFNSIKGRLEELSSSPRRLELNKYRKMDAERWGGEFLSIESEILIMSTFFNEREKWMEKNISNL